MATQTSTSLRFAVVITFVGGFLDAYTYIARGGVFANAQTGNVILLGVDLSEGKWHGASEHLWPIVAFIAGIAFASFIKSERAQRTGMYPMRWTVAVLAGLLVAVGFLPDTVSNSVVTIPIAFVSAVLMGLFRTVGGLAFMPIATTGNLMRFTEAGYNWIVEKQREQGPALRTYAVIIAGFASGAVIGAVVSDAWRVHATWVAAGLLVLTLVWFFVDERSD
ncbi:DUF1275 domain-containing protein [Aldersonia sp. NBC_00410]|uniref:YoaK family protein n=1 Tax=Aldersonia sp. NBC_00410 TaxID=2975954 RepID=UPI0022594BF0|nr:YoaK family protein [Aldersonia sp. NBC_00410]MCX5045115.1 DUF1275 domain-containing protein [Aldersonia sp. NBC_00410]